MHSQLPCPFARCALFILGASLLLHAYPACANPDKESVQLFTQAYDQRGEEAFIARLNSELDGAPDSGAYASVMVCAAKSLIERKADDKEREAAVRVIDALITQDQPRLAAELMLYFAESRLNQWDEFIRGSLMDRAGLLMQSEDFFTRYLAAWALHGTVIKDNDGGEQKWPANDAPEWYTIYESVAPEEWTRMEHVLQVTLLGQHRSSGTLLEDLKERHRAAEELLLYRKDQAGNTDAQNWLKRSDFEAITKAKDLAGAGKAYLIEREKIRRAIISILEPEIPALAYAERRGFVGQHNISGGSPSPTRHPPGTDIVIDDLDPTTPPKSILNNQLGPGAVRGLDLFYDGSRFVFAFASIPEWRGNENAYHVQEWKIEGAVPQDIYEIDIDGSGLRRVTTDTTWNDTEPTYLPDGSIVFASDRGAGASQCGTWEQSTAALNLFRVWPEKSEGGRIKRLTYNKDFDRYPHVLNNGLIGYLRWDYQERHLFQPHALWAIRPDGTNNDAIYKQHMTHGPLSLRDAMPIPGSSKLVAIATGHHHIPEGVLMRVSLDHGVNNPQGMELLATGYSSVQGGIHNSIKPVPEGGVKDSLTARGGYYQTPWALDEKRFIVGHAPAAHFSAGYRLVYVDVWGNKELLAMNRYREMVYPIAVKPRQAPPMLPETTKPDMDYGLVYVENVYADLPGVEKGAAKYIRISSRPEWPYFKDDYGALRWIPNFGFKLTFGFWSWSPARVIGTVPVNEDGSAYFKVPARLAVYFQLLDRNKMEIRRMRSHVEFQKGEIRGCIGCHETRADTVASQSTFLQGGLQAAPHHPEPPPFGQGNLDYEEMIQPIFDRHCVSCHGQDNPEGGIELTSRKDGYGFMQGYRSLFGIKWGDPLPMEDSHAKWYETWVSEYRGSLAEYDGEVRRDFQHKLPRSGQVEGQLVSVIDRQSDASISRPYQFGSTQSRLATTLIDEKSPHFGVVELTDGEWETLVAWIDANAPYSGKFYLKQGPGGTLLEKVIPVEVRYPDPWDSPGEFSNVGEVLVPADLRPGPGHGYTIDQEQARID